MNNKSNILFFICVIFLGVLNSNSQSNENDIKEYFNQYLNSKDQFRLIAKSLPTLEQCKVVFKDEYAPAYYNFISKLDEQINIEISKLEHETHIDCKIDSFNTNDLKNNNSNYNGGMSEFAQVFNPDINFYRLTYLLENGSESYKSTYKFFVNIDGNWLFFANPSIVFRK